MLRYDLNKNFSILIERASARYFAKPLINILLKEKNIKKGWGKIKINNFLISYRIVEKI